MTENSFRMEYPSTGLRQSTRETQFFDQMDDFSLPSYSPRPLSVRSSATTLSPINSPRTYPIDTSDAETNASGYSTDQGVFAGPITEKEKALMSKLSRGGLKPAEREEKAAFVTQTPRKRLVKKDSREFHRRKTLVFSQGSVAGTPRFRDDGFFVRDQNEQPTPSTSYNIPSNRSILNSPQPPSPLPDRPTTPNLISSSLRGIVDISRERTARSVDTKEILEQGVNVTVSTAGDEDAAKEEDGGFLDAESTSQRSAAIIAEGTNTSEVPARSPIMDFLEQPGPQPASPSPADRTTQPPTSPSTPAVDELATGAEEIFGDQGEIGGCAEQAIGETEVAEGRIPVPAVEEVETPVLIDAPDTFTSMDREIVGPVSATSEVEELSVVGEKIGDLAGVEDEGVVTEVVIAEGRRAEESVEQADTPVVVDEKEDEELEEVEEEEVIMPMSAEALPSMDEAAEATGTAGVGGNEEADEIDEVKVVKADVTEPETREVEEATLRGVTIAETGSDEPLEPAEAGGASSTSVGTGQEAVQAELQPVEPLPTLDSMVVSPTTLRSPLSEAGNSTFNVDSPLPTARAPSASMMLALSTNRPERHFERNIHDDGGPMMLSPVMSLDGMNQAIMQDIISPLKLASPSVRGTPSRHGLKERFALSPVVQKENMVKPHTPSQRVPLLHASPLATSTYQAGPLPPSIKVPDRRLMKSQKAEKNRAQQVSAQLDLIASRMMPFPSTSQHPTEHGSMTFEMPSQVEATTSSSRSASKSSRRRSLRLMQLAPDKAADVPPVTALPAPSDLLAPSISAPNFAPSLPSQIRQLPVPAGTPARPTTSRPPASEQVSRIRPVGRSLLKQPSISNLPSIKSSFPSSAIGSDSQRPIPEPSIFNEGSTIQRSFAPPARTTLTAGPVRSPVKKLDHSILGTGPVRPFMGAQLGAKRIAPVHPLPTPSKPTIASFGSPMRKPMMKSTKLGESSIMQSPSRPLQASTLATPRKPSSLWQSTITAASAPSTTKSPSPVKSAPAPVSPIKQPPSRPQVSSAASSIPSRIPSLAAKSSGMQASSSSLSASASTVSLSMSQTSPLKVPPSRKPVVTSASQSSTSTATASSSAQPEPVPSQSSAPALPVVAPAPTPPSVPRSRSGRAVRRPPTLSLANALAIAGERAMKTTQSKTPKPKSDSLATRKREEESMALAELNRARNEVVFSALNRIKIRKPGKRPEGEPPTIAEKEKAAKEKAKAGKGKKREQETESEVSEREETPSDRHRRAPGDLEEYMTPARPAKRRRESDDQESDASSNGGKAYKRARGDSEGREVAGNERRVKWDKGLILIGDSVRKSEGANSTGVTRSCLKSTRPLDDNGNLIGASEKIPDIRASSIDVWVIRYDGEEFEDGSPGPAKAKKASAKKKSSGSAGSTPAQPLAKKKAKA